MYLDTFFVHKFWNQAYVAFLLRFTFLRRLYRKMSIVIDQSLQQTLL